MKHSELAATNFSNVVAHIVGDSLQGQRIDVAVDRVVVNAVSSAPFPPGLDDLDRRLAALPDDLPLTAAPRPSRPGPGPSRSC